MLITFFSLVSTYGADTNGHDRIDPKAVVQNFNKAADAVDTYLIHKKQDAAVPTWNMSESTTDDGLPQYTCRTPTGELVVSRRIEKTTLVF